MKKGNKIILSLLLLFVFTINVKAGVTSVNCLDLDLKSPGNPAHFDVKVETCDWTFLGTYSTVIGNDGKETHPLVRQAEKVAEEEITVWSVGVAVAGSVKGDSVTIGGGDLVKVKRCDDKKAFVETEAHCTIYFHASKCVNHPGKAETYSKNCCASKNSKYACGCGDGEPAYTECTCNGETKRYAYGTDKNKVTCTDDWNLSPNHKNYFMDSSIATSKYTHTKAMADCKKEVGDRAGFSKCGPCQTQHTLKCPMYGCIPKEQVVGACAPEYSYNNDDVYCVNPGLTFTEKKSDDGYGLSDSQGYRVDSTFDFRDCNTSYQSEECGYANILIESEWLKQKGGVSESLLDYQTVNLAMRLYGAHVSARGYIELSGLGIYSTDAGTDNTNGEHCPQSTLYMFTPSVYTRTDYKLFGISRAYLEYVTNKYEDAYIDASKFESDTRFDDMKCDKIGYICKSGGRDYRHVRVALGLLFNTILGNNKMKDHIEDLYGVTFQTVKSAELISSESSGSDEWSLISTDFGDINYEKIEVGKEYSCEEEELNKLDPELAERLRPYCKTTMRYFDSNGVDITNIAMDYCSGKHALRCVSRPIKVATCDKSERTQYVTYNYGKNKSSTPGPDGEKSNVLPAKLISCENPDQNQFMYGLLTDKAIKKSAGTDSDYDGKAGDGTSSSDSKSDSETIRVFSHECNKVTCSDTSIRDKTAKCEAPKSKEESDSREDGVVTGYVKDPSLKCILNASEDAKYRYDYSDVFGVNTNLCRVYCSDEVDYYIPDKTTIKGGLGIQYDIGVKSYLNRTDNRLISNVVKEKRTCVSEIYYSNFKHDTRWEKIYGFSLALQKKALGTLADGSVRPISGWEDLYKVLSKVKGSAASSSEGKTITENLNELIYDLYNCNFFDESVFKANNVHRPRQRAFGTSDADENVYKSYIKKEYSASNSYYYGLRGGNNKNNEPCTYDSSTGKLSCMKMDSIYYKGGSETTTGKKAGQSPGDADTKIILDNVSSGSLSSVKYCRGSECFAYDNPGGTQKETYDLNSYEYTRNNSISYTNSDGKMIPRNDYALFSVSTEIGFYNNTSFQTEPSTGKVSIITNERDSGRLEVPHYSYPTSKNAYSNCAEGTSSAYYKSGNGIYKVQEYNNCKVEHKYSQLNTYYRVQFNDNFYNKIVSPLPSCYYDVTGAPPTCPPGSKNCPGTALDVGEYRNVNRSNLFPVETNSEISTNWDTEEGEEAKIAIENAADQIFNDDEYLQYSFELNPTQIKNIRAYNRSAASYVDIPVDKCELTEKGTYLKCRSVDGGLLYEIRSSQNDGSNSSYATILDNHDGSDLFYSSN